MNKVEEIRTVKKFVGAVLRDIPKTRDDDRLLALEVWERQGLHLTDEQRAVFMRCMNAEVMAVARREVQRDGWYRGNKYQDRQQAFDFVRSNINK